MKTINPFHPTVPLMTVQLPRNNRQRFKTAVYSVLVAHVAFLLVLLAQGYQGELTVAARSPDPAEASSKPMDQAPVAESNVNPATAVKSPSARSGLSTELAASPADTFYMVKSGDTLMQIARLHGTTVKALKAANSLTSERLAIGSKLRIPATKTSASRE